MKYPGFIMPAPGMRVFETIPKLRQTSVDFEGLEAATVFYKDFLFPPRCTSLKQADILVHVYDDTLNSLRRKYGHFAQFSNYSGFMRTEGSRAKPQQGEQEVSSVRECTGIHECYVLADFDQDGQDEWYFCIFDLPNERFVFRDYLKNHMKEAPFVMIPGLEKVENRPYGVGVYDMLKEETLIVDLQINRINIKGSKSQSATFCDPSAIEECKDGSDFILGSEHVYRLTTEAAAKYGPGTGPVYRVNLSELTEQEWKILETAVQFAQIKIGLLSAADGSVSDLNSSKTATGVASNERSGNAMRDKTADLRASCFRQLLEMMTDLILENMPPWVAFYMEDGQTLMTLSREEIRQINRDVRLLLTKARSAESLQRNAQAVDTVERYLMRSKADRKLMRSFYVEQLRALDVQDADEKLPEPTDEEIQAEAQAAAAAAQAGDKQQKESLAINYKDAPGPIRRQMEQLAGFQPLSPEQEQAEEVKAAVQEQTPTPAHHAKPNLVA